MVLLKYVINNNDTVFIIMQSIGNVTHADPWKSNESSVLCTGMILCCVCIIIILFLIVTIDTNNSSDENLKLDEDEYLEVILSLWNVIKNNSQHL